MASFHIVASAVPGTIFAVFRDNQPGAAAVAQAMRAAGVAVVAHAALSGRYDQMQQTELFQPLIVAAVAQACLFIDDMEPKNSDSSDFHDIHVANLGRVMQAMLQIGAASQAR